MVFKLYNVVALLSVMYSFDCKISYTNNIFCKCGVTLNHWHVITFEFLLQVVPQCPRCPDIPLAIMKPDIVFFGENLPEMFHRAMKQDKDEVDLLIVIGSSLKVRPVALIPSMW